MLVLLVEHVMSYIFGILKTIDLKKNGVPNRFGIETAPREFCLRIIEILVDIGIFAWIIVYVVGMTE
jgi:hypothetical protein